MKSAIAILTYRRAVALANMMVGVEKHCPLYSCGIFEDCGQRDITADVLQAGRVALPRPDLMAFEYVPENEMLLTRNFPNAQVFMGSFNLGVAGNSNRALKWFMDGDWDHLCLCNDDLLVNGDFVAAYAKAHEDLDIGMFCFCDFDKASPAISGNPETYKWTVYPWRGYQLKFLPRFTGIMISITRALVEKIGFFDAVFGKFGEEHCDYTIRARQAGGIQLNNQDMNCLDFEHGLLGHQDCQTSVTGAAREQADREASAIMQQVSRTYAHRHYHRPCRLLLPKNAAGYSGGGIPVQHLLDSGYVLVSDVQQ